MKKRGRLKFKFGEPIKMFDPMEMKLNGMIELYELPLKKDLCLRLTLKFNGFRSDKSTTHVSGEGKKNHTFSCQRVMHNFFQ